MNPNSSQTRRPGSPSTPANSPPRSPCGGRRWAGFRRGARIAPVLYLFAVFLMACFVGYYVVWNVTPALHIPLMAVTNAISSVIIVGAMLAAGLAVSGWAMGFGFLAVDPGQREHLRRLPRDAADARDVQGAGRSKRCLAGLDRSLLSRRRRPVHPGAARPVSPVTSRQGNRFGMVGMAIAIVATLLLSTACRAPATC